VPFIPKSGSIFDSHCEYLVNTVNLRGAMGRGLALEFRFRIPEMYLEYREQCLNKRLAMGRYWIYTKENRLGKKVLNFPTKNHYAHPSKLEYILQGLEYFVENYRADGITSIAFPLLGSRHGKLDYRDVYEVMKEYLADLPIKIEVYINNTSCDKFTLAVKKLIEDMPDTQLMNALDFDGNLVSDLKQYIKSLKSLIELVDFPKFSIEKVQRIYDLGFEHYPRQILI
jgi:O-acetyl-ADP-ribose deacetylase (regulator of RNase III)